ncbi:hypothetical protein [Kitasatospora sp. NPDC018619]|uniref:hypothetical protein n=1 Tax=unclassified Kitasatospora TaxID=2633591 RepID=UPI00378B6032
MITEPLTVSIDGHLDPITRPPVEALAAVWHTLQPLPMDGPQYRAARRMFGGGRTDDLERWMHGDERTDVPIGLADGSAVIVRVEYGDRMTCRQRVGARYVARRVERPPGRSEQWEVWDTVTDAPATDWLPRPAATEWIRRQVQNATFQRGAQADAR